jgi:hypothetical protein
MECTALLLLIQRKTKPFLIDCYVEIYATQQHMYAGSGYLTEKPFASERPAGTVEWNKLQYIHECLFYVIINTAHQTLGLLR